MFTEFSWLKAAPYIAVIVLITGLGAYGKYEHAGKVSAESKQAEAEKALSGYVAQVAATQAADHAQKEASRKQAEDDIKDHQAKVNALESELSKLGITREQTKKELNDALKSSNEMLVSRNNVLDGLNRLQSATSQDSVRASDTSEVLPISKDQCIRASETVRIISKASIFAVNDYDSCITALTAVYKQLKQPIRFTDDAP